MTVRESRKSYCYFFPAQATPENENKKFLSTVFLKNSQAYISCCILSYITQFQPTFSARIRVTIHKNNRQLQGMNSLSRQNRSLQDVLHTFEHICVLVASNMIFARSIFSTKNTTLIHHVDIVSILEFNIRYESRNFFHIGTGHLCHNLEEELLINIKGNRIALVRNVTPCSVVAG
jgi:hypothetical protein